MSERLEDRLTRTATSVEHRASIAPRPTYRAVITSSEQSKNKTIFGIIPVWLSNLWRFSSFRGKPSIRKTDCQSERERESVRVRTFETAQETRLSPTTHLAALFHGLLEQPDGDLARHNLPVLDHLGHHIAICSPRFDMRPKQVACRQMLDPKLVHELGGPGATVRAATVRATSERAGERARGLHSERARLGLPDRHVLRPFPAPRSSENETDAVRLSAV